MSMLDYVSPKNDQLSQNAFLTKVYGWMTVGLVVTATLAVAIAQPAIFDTYIRPIFAVRYGFIIFIVAQMLVALGLQTMINRISATVATGLFLLYSAMTGVVFSIYFHFFTSESLALTFFVTAGTFAGMSVFGYFTKRDLTSLGSLLVMVVWGLILASVVNMFMNSSALYWITTYVGIIAFVLLIAYDTQKMKYMYMVGPDGSEVHQKAAILAAFSLYLDFVILFQYLLRLLGSRRN